MCGTHARGFRFSDGLYQIASPDGGAQPHLRHLQRQGTGTLRLRRLRRFDRRLRTRRQKTARFRLPQPHHGRTQPARRTGVPLRIRPLRHRRQSA